MFFLPMLLFLSGCLRNSNHLITKKIKLNCNKIEINSSLKDAFTVEWFSKLEHTIISSFEQENIIINILESRYSYEECKLKVLDLAIYQEDKLSGFRIVFSNLEDRGDLPDKIADWIINFLKEKFGTIEEEVSTAKTSKEQVANKLSTENTEMQNQENLLNKENSNISDVAKQNLLQSQVEGNEMSSNDDSYNKLRIE